MKNLIIQLCLWIIDKLSVQCIVVRPGHNIWCNGSMYKIDSVSQTFNYTGPDTLEIKAVDALSLLEVSVNEHS